MVWQELPLDRIYFDATLGVPGTVWPIGTPSNPSDVIADVITMCEARNLRTIVVDGSLTLGAAMEHYSFVGPEHLDPGDQIDLNAQDVDGSYIESIMVTGEQGGSGFLVIRKATVNGVTEFYGLMNECDFYGNIGLADACYADINNCQSIYTTTVLTVQAPTRASVKNWSGNLTLALQDGGVMLVRGFKGSLVIDEMTLGALDIYANGADITINADCTGGTINIYGSAVITDNSVGAVVNDYTLDQRTANIDTQLDGQLVQVPFYNLTESVKDGTITLFEFDALGATIREIFISFYLADDNAPTYTLTWEKTRPDDLVTFVVEQDPAIANIATPAAAGYHSYKLGELAQGLQGRFRIAQSNDGNVNNDIDGYAIALMVV